MKKYMLLAVVSVWHLKRFHFGGRHFTHDKEAETEMREWLTQ
jgi:hypothetical protein